jgi:hypothetical protein
MSPGVPDLAPYHDAAYYLSQTQEPRKSKIAKMVEATFARFNRTESVDPRDHLNWIVDIGAGMGQFLVEFSRLGVSGLFAVDHPTLYRAVGVPALPKIVSYDFRDFKYPLVGIYREQWSKAQLVLCIDVWDELEAETMDYLILEVARLNGRLVVSMGKTPEVAREVANRIAEFGRQYNPSDSAALTEAWTDHLAVFDPVR